MWQKEKGIVLHKLKYTDSSLIVKIFTQKSGYKSFLVRGIRSKKNKVLPLLQSLNVIDFQSNIRDNHTIHSLKDLQSDSRFNQYEMDLSKSSLILFICEILYKSLEDDYENPELFEFIINSIVLLNNSDKISNFHIWFLLEMSRNLGFYPTDNYSKSNPCFDLSTGEFIRELKDRNHHMNEESSEDLASFLGMIFDEAMILRMTQNRRYNLLENLIKYYKFHMEGMRVIKSHEVFKEVFYK